MPTKYRVPFMGGLLLFDAAMVRPGLIKAKGQLQYPGSIAVGFEADVRLGVGIKDPDGVIGAILQVVNKLQAAQEGEPEKKP